MADSRLTVVVRPEASVVLTVVRVVPDLLTRLSTVVEGFCVEAVDLVELDVLDVLEALDELEVLEVLDLLEELSRLGEVCAVWVLRAEVPPVEVEVAVELVELVERAEVEVLFSFSLAA